MKMSGQEFTAPIEATGDPRELGVQDLVVIAVKGPALPGLAASARRSAVIGFNK